MMVGGGTRSGGGVRSTVMGRGATAETASRLRILTASGGSGVAVGVGEGDGVAVGVIVGVGSAVGTGGGVGVLTVQAVRPNTKIIRIWT
jgi:hypothetical protein